MLNNMIKNLPSETAKAIIKVKNSQRESNPFIHTIKSYSINDFINTYRLDEFSATPADKLIEKDKRGKYKNTELIESTFINEYLNSNLTPYLYINTKSINFIKDMKEHLFDKFIIKFANLSVDDESLLDYVDFDKIMATLILERKVLVYVIDSLDDIFIIDKSENQILDESYISDMFTASFKKDYSDYKSETVAEISKKLRDNFNSIQKFLSHDIKVISNTLVKEPNYYDYVYYKTYLNRLKMLNSRFNQ